MFDFIYKGPTTCMYPVMECNYKMAKVSQNTTIFISYEWVDHIAVYNYMFRPLSDIIRLYCFLL